MCGENGENFVFTGGAKDGAGKLSETLRYLEKVVGPTGSRSAHRSRPS